MEIPIIDLRRIEVRSSMPTQELQKLREALSKWGCFQAINHGLSLELLNKVREIIEQFFRLPLEEKQKYLRGDEIDGLVLSTKQELDWYDRLYLITHPEDRRKLKFWPQNPESFRSIFHEYSMKMKLIAQVVLKAMARSLNLDESSFLEQYGKEAKMYARCNFYPPCPRPDRVVGFGSHSDGSAITLILQDEKVQGLQFLIEGQWLKAPIIPEALLVNVGDIAQISTNGIFKSLLHRAVTNSEKERVSLPMFYVPQEDKEVEPFEELVDETSPRLYKKIKNYPDFYFKYYRRGKRALDALKI